MFWAFLCVAMSYTLFLNGDQIDSMLVNGAFIIGNGKNPAVSLSPFYNFDLNRTFDIESEAKSVYAINHYAFKGTKIKSILLPSTLTEIGIYAFSSCLYLQELDLSHTNVKVIPRNMLSDSINLKRLLLPEGVEQICARAFSNTKIKQLRG